MITIRCYSHTVAKGHRLRIDPKKVTAIWDNDEYTSISVDGREHRVVGTFDKVVELIEGQEKEEHLTFGELEVGDCFFTSGSDVLCQKTKLFNRPGSSERINHMSEFGVGLFLEDDAVCIKVKND